MSLTDIVRGGLASIQSLVPDASVSVVISGDSGTGLRATNTDTSQSNLMGDLGVDANLVRVSAYDFDPPETSSTIIVDDEPVTVTSVRIDNMGATIAIVYVKQQATA